VQRRETPSSGIPPRAGTGEGNRTYFEDNKGRRWMMIEKGARTTIIPH
jgi:hypothetical protein